MSDMKLTWMLRAVLFVAGTAVAMFVVTMADVSLDALYKHWLGFSSPRTVECGFFFLMLIRWLWRWLVERVWIGRLPESKAR